MRARRARRAGRGPGRQAGPAAEVARVVPGSGYWRKVGSWEKAGTSFGRVFEVGSVVSSTP